MSSASAPPGLLRSPGQGLLIIHGESEHRRRSVYLLIKDALACRQWGRRLLHLSFTLIRFIYSDASRKSLMVMSL